MLDFELPKDFRYNGNEKAHQIYFVIGKLLLPKAEIFSTPLGNAAEGFGGGGHEIICDVF